MAPGAADFLPRTGQERGKELPPTSAFAADDGTAPPALAAALALAGPDRVPAVVAALASARVLVPVVAHEETEKDADIRERFTGRREPRRRDVATATTSPEGSAEPGAPGGSGTSEPSCHDGEREASASLVTVRTPDGREALPIFSSVTELGAWRSDARPVPHEATRTAMAAIDEAGGVLVLDAGSGAPVLIPRPAVWALARGEQWVPAPADPGVRSAMTDLVLTDPQIAAAEVVAGERAEVKVILAVQPGLDRGEVEAVAARVAQALSESVVVAERVDSVELALTTAPAEG